MPATEAVDRLLDCNLRWRRVRARTGRRWFVTMLPPELEEDVYSLYRWSPSLSAWMLMALLGLSAPVLVWLLEDHPVVSLAGISAVLAIILADHVLTRPGSFLPDRILRWWLGL